MTVDVLSYLTALVEAGHEPVVRLREHPGHLGKEPSTHVEVLVSGRVIRTWQVD